MREIAGLIYIFRFLICGGAFGLVLIRLNVFTSFPKQKTFCIGVCSTPMFLSLIDYLLGLIWRGIPSICITAGVPLALVGFSLTKKSREILDSLFQAIKEYVLEDWLKGANKYRTLVCAIVLFAFFTCLVVAIGSKIEWLSHAVKAYAYRAESNQSWAVLALAAISVLVVLVKVYDRKKETNFDRLNLLCRYMILFGAGLVLCMITAYAFLKTNVDLNEWDRSHYERQARYFAETREAAEIDNYHDEKYGTVFMDDHGPLWPVYIADARMCSGKYDDYFNPLTVDLAYFLVVLCYLGMVVVTTWVITDSLTHGLLAALILCVYPYAFWIYIIGSRDSFRVIGILLLTMYILEICNRLYMRTSCKEQCIKKVENLFLALLCYLCMQGHGANAYVMLGLFVAFGCMAIVKKINKAELVQMAVAVLIGTLAGIHKTILVYINTGQISSSTTVVFEGTEVATRYRQAELQAWTWETVLNNYRLVDWCIIVLGIMGIIAAIYALIKYKSDNRYRKISLFVVLAMGLMMPLTGVMNFMGYNIALSYLRDTRYRLYFFVLLAIIGASAVKIYVKNNCRFKWAGILLIVMLAFNSSMIPFKDMDVTEANSMTGSWREFAERVEELAGDGEIYVQHEAFAYYFYKAPKLLYHPIVRELMIAKDEEEVEKVIKELNISVITFHSSMGRYDFELLPLYDYLENSPDVEKMTLKASNDSNLPLYLIK